MDRCKWCERKHGDSDSFMGHNCPYVKAIEYHENGTVHRVEFYEQNQTVSNTTVMPSYEPARANDPFDRTLRGQ